MDIMVMGYQISFPIKTTSIYFFESCNCILDLSFSTDTLCLAFYRSGSSFRYSPDSANICACVVISMLRSSFKFLR